MNNGSKNNNLNAPRASRSDAGSASGTVIAAGPAPVVDFPSGRTSPDRANGLRLCLEEACRKQKKPIPVVLPAEAVTLVAVDIPVRGARAQRAALPFAVEEQVAMPLEEVHVSLCRPAPGPGSPNRLLAAIVGSDLMTASARDDAPVLPETFAIPTPARAEDRDTWAVWRDGARAIVRRSDGTGFAVQAEMLARIWTMSGRPAVLSYGAALPPALDARDLSHDRPPPDPKDLAIDLRQGAFAHRQRDLAPTLRFVAAVVGIGLAVHVGIAAADLLALQRIAGTERAIAEDALAPLLPGVQVDTDPAMILSRLAPQAVAVEVGDALPLLVGVAETLLAGGPDVTWRRATFNEENATLSLLVQAGGLDDLLEAERLLEGAGFAVSSGVATADQGAAEAEFQVTRGAPL